MCMLIMVIFNTKFMCMLISMNFQTKNFVSVLYAKYGVYSNYIYIYKTSSQGNGSVVGR